MMTARRQAAACSGPPREGELRTMRNAQRFFSSVHFDVAEDAADIATSTSAIKIASRAPNQHASARGRQRVRSLMIIPPFAMPIIFADVVIFIFRHFLSITAAEPALLPATRWKALPLRVCS